VRYPGRMSAESLSGIALSRRFFFAVGLPLLQETSPALCERLAAGLLPDLPPGLAAAVEQLAARLELATVEVETASLLDLVGGMANDSGLIAPQLLRKATPFLWTDFNCYGFAAAFDALLPEPLRGRLTAGPIDLWVSNHAALSPAVARARCCSRTGPCSHADRGPGSPPA